MSEASRPAVREKYLVHIGGRLPDFTQPLILIAGSSVQPGRTIVETYFLKPVAPGTPRRFWRDGATCRSEPHDAPEKVSLLDVALTYAVENASARIEREEFENVELSMRMMLLGNERYRLIADDPSRLFRFKWRFGFGPELKRISKVTSCASLRAYLELVEGVSVRFDPMPDPFADLTDGA